MAVGRACPRQSQECHCRHPVEIVVNSQLVTEGLFTAPRYETLEQSSRGGHEGQHDPWPYINYVLSIMKSACRELAERVGEVKAPRGAKRDQVLIGIERLAGRAGGVTISELEQTCPGVSRDKVRRVLREQSSAGAVECQVWAGGNVGEKRGNYP